MKRTVLFLFWLQQVFICDGVPPTPVDRLWEELDNTRGVMTNIATQLEKFNTLYLMKLEQKMMTVATTLTNIDSNIKNLQERAHVWDTFQLHVAAWNEQISTLDKKVEIISKGQEKMLALDSKVNILANIEYKVERMSGKQDDLMSLLQTLTKIVEHQPHDPLLEEFTARGVLSTLKIIERKLDKLQMQYSSSQSMIAKQLVDNKRKSEADLEQRGKLLIKCHTPPKVEELLSDVSSKVDVIFDKFTESEEGSENNQDEQKDSSEVSSQESKSDTDLKLIRGLLKRLNQPCKRTVKVLENLETSIKTIDNTTLSILEDGQVIHNDLLNYCQNNDKKIQTINSKTTSISNKIDDLVSSMNTKLINEQELLTSHFQEQREHFAGIFKTAFKTNILTNPPIIASNLDVEIYDNFPTSTEPTAYSSATFTDKLNCEELDSTYVSGIYALGDSDQMNSAGRKLNTRYCDIRDNVIWTVIQRRGNNPKAQNFSLSWVEYKNGFGSLDRDFWFGNDFIHTLTAEKDMILRIELKDFEGNMAWAEYSIFKVLGEDKKYKLLVGDFKGNASDSFSSHNNAMFSSYDRTNDDAPACCPCSPSYGGGWWFTSCFEANLNGVYHSSPKENEYFRGLIWEHWLGNYSLRQTKMMIRPKVTNDTESRKWNKETETGSGTEPDNRYDIPEDP